MNLIFHRGPSGRRALGLVAWGLAVLFFAVPNALPAAPSGFQSTFRGALAADPELNAYYQTRRFRPLWVRGSTVSREADSFVQIVEQTGGPEGASRLAALIAQARTGSPAALAEAEMRLTRAFLAHHRGSQQTGVSMVYVDDELSPADVVRERSARIRSSRGLRAQLRDLTRTNLLHRQLEAGLAAYQMRWGALPRNRIASGGVLRVGSTGSRVRQLRRRLGFLESGPFDFQVENAVRAYQATHGLEVDGIVGRGTVTSLNRGPEHYERTILANMERLRALPADLGRRFLLVDAADSRLWMYEEGRPVDSMRVIVGKEAQPTPMMAALMRFVVLNPYWNIPPDLVRDRIVPGVQANGLGFLRERRYQLLSDWSDNPRTLDPASVNWSAVGAGRQELRVRQLPGRDNFMGAMKFMMPNDLGIYLHDTPSRELFDQPGRRFSSGCVRVEDYQRLAQWLFNGRVPRPNGSAEQRVDLPRPVPVYITYLTAAPAPQGIVFRSDAYGRDAPLLARLGNRRTLAMVSQD
jgi:murein L,D-transpeptidase YcbB/YkuD